MLNRLELPLGALILRQAREFWWIYLLALTAIFFSHRLQVELPFMARDLGEIVLSKRFQDIPYTWYFLIALGIIFFRTLSRILFFWPARVFQGKLQEELTIRLEQAPPWRYQYYPPGQLYQCLIPDMVSIRSFIGFGLLQLGNTIIALAVIIPRLLDFDRHLLVAFTPLAICLLGIIAITTFSQQFYRQMMDLQGDVQSFIMESYQGKKTIKNFQAEGPFLELFEQRCQAELRAFFKGSVGMTGAIPLVRVGVGMAFLWGSAIIYQEDLGNTSLILFSGFVFLLQTPLTFFSWLGTVASRSFGSWQRVKQLVQDLETTSPEETSTTKLNHQQQNFHLNLWEKPAQFPFQGGQWNVVIGKTGAGKSYLLERYATLLKSRKTPMSYVAQEPHLYNDTISNNLFLGNPSPPEQIQRALQLLSLFQLETLSDDLHNVLPLEVGENGKRISGGQAKRLVLIRSLLSNSEIFIWDDPFSSIDLILEKKITTQLKADSQLRGKTFILSSHRYSTVKNCDLIFYTEQYQGLVECGPPVPDTAKKYPNLPVL